jgi:hypothetical protein
MPNVVTSALASVNARLNVILSFALAVVGLRIRLETTGVPALVVVAGGGVFMDVPPITTVFPVGVETAG